MKCPTSWLIQWNIKLAQALPSTLLPFLPPNPKWSNSVPCWKQVELGRFHQAGFLDFNKAKTIESFGRTYSFWEVFVEVHRNKNIYKV